MENDGIFYGHLEYFTVIWYILWPYFPHFGMLCQEKSGNPAYISENFVVRTKCVVRHDKRQDQS
jgi:hypothetical protein